LHLSPLPLPQDDPATMLGCKGDETSMMTAGTQAPDFSVRDHDGKTVRLADLLGRKVILWFYPKADTPG
jgi:peroxiredoxin Q/BCP